MSHQKSILTFFQKPSTPEGDVCRLSSTEVMFNGDRPDLFSTMQQNQIAAAGDERVMDAPLEIPGIDTPPEKPPRPVFHSRFMSTGDTPSSFSSIMHKFVKSDENQTICQRNKGFGVSSNTCPLPSNDSNNSVLPQEKTTFHKFENDTVPNPNYHVNESSTLHIDIVDGGFGPETPGIKPLVPRFKRIQEESSNVGDDIVCLQKSSKRLKFLQDARYEKESTKEISDTETKFQWLQPCHIKDASGRRPDDFLYDKRTLYIPPEALMKMTASQKQYWEVKCQYMDVLIFFKVGKFYELYELDAEIGRKELDWKMTLSGVGKCRQVGIPESGIDDAVQKLIARGYKVGRMEQLETSDQAKARGAYSVIQRKLIHVNTPSTAVDDNIGPDAVHLLAIKEVSPGLENCSVMFGFAFSDCAALKFWVGSVSDDASHAALVALLMQVSPMEVIYENPGLSKEAQTTLRKYALSGSSGLQLTPVPPGTDFLDASKIRNLIQLKGYFKSSYSNDYPLDNIVDSDLVLCALGGLVSQLSRMMLDDVLCNGVVLPYQVFRGCLRMDGQTLRNLEIFNNSADGGPAGTLYKYLNGCLTASGKRVLRSWICHPLNDVSRINGRLSFVESLIQNPEVLLLAAQHLQKLPDMERLLGRIKASVNSTVSLSLPLVGKKSLKQRVKIFGCLVKGLRIGFNVLVLLKKEHHIFMLFSDVLKNTVLSDSNDLDEFLTQFEAAIGMNFPNYQDHGIIEGDAEVLTAMIELFVERADQWSKMIHAISCFDVLRSFAVTANSSCGAMCRPSVIHNSGSTNGGPVLKMKGLWHPFALGDSGIPVPNDIHLGEEADLYHPRTLLLTGPNMGGKSTLLRATCLAVLLAQLGCYVPCEECILTPVDIIFTRLGATDRIMTGESTFFVECTETSSVLRNATENSLVLLDELGRGTSTFDGYAIAYAVFRHLIEHVNCRLLFATHYHPLTKEFGTHPRVMIQHMACSFKAGIPENSDPANRDLIFLYKLVAGACPESYGMQVALMAGIPDRVVEAARRAGGALRHMIAGNFKTSEQRYRFSALHEEWLKALVGVTDMDEGKFDDDAFDTLFTLWHELRGSYRKPSTH